jgi:CubicO group peptidase (beta-lactamase class C family)
MGQFLVSPFFGDQTSIARIIESKDFPISSPEEQGLNSTLLNQLDVKMKEVPQFSTSSMLILRHRNLVFEKYYQNFSQDTKHYIWSVTKSITSTLIGIAIDKGLIQSVNEKVLDYFPNMTFNNVDSRKEAMTIEHLLTQTSGLNVLLSWQEEIDQLNNSLDPVQTILDTPMKADPGTVYKYFQGPPHLLSTIIQKITGNTTQLFAQKYLFEPIGINSSEYTWETDKKGVVFGNIGIEMSSRNMAKIGLLFANNGTWNGSQVVSSDWIKNATKDYVYPLGHGYLWYIDQYEGYYAAGYEGKYIEIIPKYDLVIVVTNGVMNIREYTELVLEAIIDRPKSTETTTTTTTSSNASGFEFIILSLLIMLALVNTHRVKSKR